MLLNIGNLNVCFQKEKQISYNELMDLEAIGEGGFGHVYQAKHAEFGTVLYKELNAKKLGNRYSKAVLDRSTSLY